MTSVIRMHRSAACDAGDMGRRLLVPFVVFLMVMWLWTTGRCSLSCLLPAQSFLFYHSILWLERKSPERAGQWRHLWSTEIEGGLPSPFGSNQHTPCSHWDLCFTRFCLYNRWVIYYAESILRRRKKVPKCGLNSHALKRPLASNFTHTKNKCSLCCRVSSIFSLTCNCSDIHSVLTSQLLLVPNSSFSGIDTTYYRPFTIKRRCISSVLCVHACNRELCTRMQVASESWRAPQTPWS